MSNRQIVCLEQTEYKMNNEEKKEYENTLLLTFYQVLFNSGKITFEQLKYLENMNRKYW